MTWRVGDFLYEMVSQGRSWPGGLIYGIVVRAGPKQISVLWEPNLSSGILRRYHAEYFSEHARFKIDGCTPADHYATETGKLIDAARRHGHLSHAE